MKPAAENRRDSYTPISQVKAEFFRTLAHPARIRVLEILTATAVRAVSELIPEVGIESSHLSQQLGIMRRANLVQSRKEGATVVYSVSNPMIFDLLDVAKKDPHIVPRRNQGSSRRGSEFGRRLERLTYISIMRLRTLARRMRVRPPRSGSSG